MERQRVWGNWRQRTSEAVLAIVRLCVCVCLRAPVTFPCCVDQPSHRLPDPHHVKSEHISTATDAATFDNTENTPSIFSLLEFEGAICLKNQLIQPVLLGYCSERSAIYLLNLQVHTRKSWDFFNILAHIVILVFSSSEWYAATGFVFASISSPSWI